MTKSVPTNVSVSTRVARRVAELEETEAASPPPLYGAVEPDALDAVIDPSMTASVTFTYARRTVSVDADGAVSVASCDQ
ncbi:HalOD1 output domain-containing protein [Halosolutus gelatinilyticus]|uniref:HalOD1 output domain-containing protein n=1 Tax=Halosolutus gelatinilyticus TaxID=2931975 RepID=UPI003CE54131